MFPGGSRIGFGLFDGFAGVQADAVTALVGPEVLGVEIELALFVELEEVAATEMTAEVAGF
ncbi:hypothetical protein FACS189475_07240 [Betaproteobacteria bacterium]|nr:hypothetical protein FACS189475_07240 [Betaproteobacteria bacterium]